MIVDFSLDYLIECFYYQNNLTGFCYFFKSTLSCNLFYLKFFQSKPFVSPFHFFVEEIDELFFYKEFIIPPLSKKYLKNIFLLFINLNLTFSKEVEC